jgi:stage II sporulation protein AB (anti-sigma F factor)
VRATDYLVLELPSLDVNVALARLVVAAFAARLEFTLTEIEEIKVAVSEAVTNAVVHAYGHHPGLVRIQAWVEDGALLVTVCDQGVGIDDVFRAREPAFSTVAERMGMGFSFMEAFCDELRVDSSPGRGTTIHMLKRPRRLPVD